MEDAGDLAADAITPPIQFALLTDDHVSRNRVAPAAIALVAVKNHGMLSRVARWLTDHAPRHRAPELAHGDAMLTNFMYDGTDVAGMLGWELSHIGIGEADIADQSAERDHFGLLAPPPPGLRALTRCSITTGGAAASWRTKATRG